MRKIKLKPILIIFISIALLYLILNILAAVRNPLLASVIALTVFGAALLGAGFKLIIVTNKNQRLNQDLNKAIFDIMALFEFTNVLGSDLRLTQMMELMVDTIKRIHYFDGCSLFFYNESEANFSVKVNQGFPEILNKTELQINDLPGGSLIKSGQAFIINDIDRDYPDLKSNHHETRELLGEFNSFILLPLMVEGKLIGLLIIAKNMVSGFNQEDFRLLMIISNQAGLAIQNRRLYEQVYYAAITDGLTGIYNHKYFREQLEYQLEKAKEYGFKISLILIDIDHFKKFNDTYGHQIGDQVLREVSQVIQDCITSDSLVARYGGEEFVVILPDAPTESALEMGEKIRRTVESHTVKTSDYSELKVTISSGIATFPDHIKNIGRMVVELIDIADENLYSAKKAGRNRVCTSVPANLQWH